MKRWSLAFLVALIAAFTTIANRSSSQYLLQDSDTRVLLSAIRERKAPLSWFTGDWPLENHFYRPVSTLTFELDNALHWNNPAGYGFTNALLCALCTLALFWFLRELTQSVSVTVCATSLFTVWTLFDGLWLAQAAMYVAIAALVGGFLRHGFRVSLYGPAFLVLLFLSRELVGMSTLRWRMIDWLPGRTASTMALFALVAMAAYARYERLGARSDPKAEPRPLDPPATRSTQVATHQKASAFWAVLSILATAMALASYEQAVMLPACLLGVALTVRWQRYRITWGLQAVFWLLLVGYLILRTQVVPSAPSQYQAQQFRSGPGVWLSIAAYVAPVLATVPSFVSSFMPEAGYFLMGKPYVFLLELASNIGAFWEARRRWVLALAGYVLSGLAFLPMAWLKPFEHYDYWPMAMRSLFVVAIGWIGLELLTIAWSPPSRQAPPRLSRAPGSLPHP